MKKILFFCLLLSLQYLLVGQSNIKSVELDLKFKKDEYNIIPVGKTGIIMFNKLDRDGYDLPWSFTLYDNEFNEVWFKTIKTNLYNTGYKYYYDEENRKLFLLFHRSANFTGGGGVYKNDHGSFSIVKIDLITGNHSTKAFNFSMDGMIQYFEVVGDKAFIGGTSVPSTGQVYLTYCTYCLIVPYFLGTTLWKTKPILFEADLNSGTGKFKEFIFKGHCSLKSMIKSEDENIKLFVKNYEEKKFVNNYLYQYDKNGDLINKTNLKVPKNKSLSIYRTLELEDGESIICGSYNIEKFDRWSGADFGSVLTVPAGVFFTKVVDDTPIFTKTYTLGQLGLRGSQSLYFMCHKEIIKLNDEFILICEMMDPVIETYTTTYYVNGQYQTRTHSYIAGYEFNKALVISFDNEGNNLWTEEINLDMSKTMKIDEKLKVISDTLYNELKLAYNYGGNIRLITIEDGEIVEDNNSIEAYSKDLIENIKTENYYSQMEFWYDNYFVAWGFQEEKDVSTKRKAKKEGKKIFYISKFEL